MLTNKKTIHIEWGDCDPLGIVYYPRYFEFFDACTNALFEAAGFPKPLLLKKFNIAGIPLLEARAKFLAPSLLATQSAWKRTSLIGALAVFPSNTNCSMARPSRSKALKNAFGSCTHPILRAA